MINSNTINIRPAYFTRILLIIVGGLFIGHCLFLFSTFVYGYALRDLLKIFDFNTEGNFPTFYSVCGLLIAAALLLFVSLVKKKNKEKHTGFWKFLGIIFLVLAFDEASEMHEKLNTMFRPYMPEQSLDFLYYAWVLPYAVVAILIGAYSINFLKDLPRKTAQLFVAAGFVFVLGAIGFELMNSYYEFNEGLDSFMLHLMYTIEELLEMLGIVLFIYAILDYMKNHMGQQVSFRLTDPNIVNKDKVTV